MNPRFMKKIFLILTVFWLSVMTYAQTTVTITTSGNWVCPAGVTSATVECWGAGGGGATTPATTDYGGGGGGGGAYSSSVLTVVPGTSYPVVVGVGAAYTNGGNTTFNTTSVVAVGGGRGFSNGGGTGGAAASCTGTTRRSGGNGGAGVTGSYSGGGGGGAGSTANGGAASGSTAGIGNAPTGGDGANGLTVNGAGLAGNVYGGGGSGGYGKSKTGGAGANGVIRITYTCPATNYYIFGTSAVSSIVAGGTSVVTLTSDASGLPVGTYTVTYDLSSPNAATGLTATMTVTTAGTGTFTTSALTNTGETTITITQLLNSGCGNLISINNSCIINVITTTIAIVNAPTINFVSCSYPTGYQTLGNIVITEQVKGNVKIGTNVTIVLTAPANFQFLAGTGSVTHVTGKNISSSSIVVTATTITVTYTCGGTNSLADQITISGIQVRATAGSPVVPVLSTGSTCVIDGVTHGTTAFAYLSCLCNCSAPTTQATNFSSSSITPTSATVSWTNGNGTAGRIVVARAGSAPNADPISGTSYTANSAYGLGDPIGGGYVVYKGTGSSVNLTALTSGTTYYLAIYEYNTVNTCYNLTQLTGSFATGTCAPSVQASAFSASAIGLTQMTIGWTRGNGNRVMVVAKAVSAPTDPVSGTSYTANSIYGSGSACGGGFVVYDGTGTSVTVTGLSSSTTYYFAIYEYNTAGLCYKTPALSGSATTTTPGTTVAIIGTGTSTVTYPYTGYYHDGRCQLIYTAADLTAAGLTPGSIITKLSFNVSTKSSTQAYSGFTVKIAQTALTAFPSATWQAPTFTQIYTGNYTVAATGWQNYPYATGFTWDGSSSLMVQCCFDNTSYTQNDPVYCTTTTGNTVCYGYADSDAGCTTMTPDAITTTRPNLRIEFTPGPNCSSAPAAMTAVATPSSICAGQSITLSFTGGTSASGITYQWQSASAVGGPYTNISGATSTTYVTSPSANTWYQIISTCVPTGQSTTSSVVAVTVNGPSYATVPYSTSFESNWQSRCDTREVPDQYWVGSPVTGNNSWRRDDDGAAAVWTSATSYMYTPAASAGSRSARFHSGYASSGTIGNLDLYINMSLITGTKSLLFDYINTSGSDHMEVLLSTDGGATFPTILNSLTLATGWITYSADIASNSATCVIRFRSTSDYGATDIGLDNIRVIAPCSGTPTAGTASIGTATFCNSGSADLTLTGYTLAGGITLQWQSSDIGSPYAWVDITGATNATCVAPTVSQTYYYRCVVKCGVNAAYSNIITFTKTAQSITGTITSPVNITCGNTTNLTATASGGATVKWYAAATGGTPVGTGSPWTTPALSVNTTYYCCANSGTTNESGGMPAKVNDYGYIYTGYGVVFNAAQTFILVDCTVYPIDDGNITIQIQNSSGTPIWTSASIAVNGGPNGNAEVIPINQSIPAGNGYRLVLSAYSGANLTDLIYDYTTSFPYSSPSGAISVTSGWYGTGTSSTNYYFYDLNISIPCESTPRVPVDVVITGGLNVPLCSTLLTPANGASNICPVGTTLTWTASNTACRAATSYKLYIGTDAGGTNLMNGVDIGNVTSYTFASLAGGSNYKWKIVPVNAAGDAAGCTLWNFTTAANPGNVCPTQLGSGVTAVASLPYTKNNGNTSGSVNDLTSANLVSCGSTSYYTGEDEVFYFTPTASGNITVTLTSTGSYTGLALFEGCPLAAGACGAAPGSCVGTAQSSTGDKTLNACVIAGITYYLILDSWASPTANPYSKLQISAPSGVAIPPNDLPCNAIGLTLGSAANGDNSCAGSSSEPAAPTCWTTGVHNTVWYSVVAPASGQISVKTVTMGLSDTQIAMYGGTSCSSLTAVTGACNNDMSGCGSTYSSLMTVSGLTPGTTYYIVVDGAYDLTGTFTIQAIDPATQILPVVPGQDCSLPLPTCATQINVSDPGYANTGNICDFSSTGNCTSGERASVWYTIDIAQNGTLMFDIIPNDYDGTEGSETDYDFLVWRTVSGTGTMPTTDCAGISSNSATALVACNFSYLGVTGLYTGGNGNPAYNGGTVWDAAYEAPITVSAGDQYIIVVQNYTQSTSGFTINYSNSSPSNLLNISATPTVVAWTGATSTAWSLAGNWGGCGSPNSCATSVIIPAYMPTMPVISSSISVKDLTINSGATLTINTGVTVTICGNLLNNGTITVNGTGHIKFAGALPQTCTNNSGILTIPIVTIDNSAGLTLNGSSGNMVIPTFLNLTNGIITTSSSAMVIMNAGSTVLPTGGSSTSFVNGPMQKLGDTDFIYPIGDGTRWARLRIDPTASSTFQAEYLATPYGTLTPMDAGQTPVLNHVSSLEHWILDRKLGAGNTYVTLYWESATLSQIWLCASYQDLSVAKWTGSAWTNLNLTSATITGSCGTTGTIKTQDLVTAFSPFTFASLKIPSLNPLGNTALPVELLAFNGRENGDVNILEWKTASETNNAYFMLTKSVDGVNFEDLVKVEGVGNSNSVSEYSRTDYHPFKPVTYYRLKQVDMDGFYNYSNIISIGTADPNGQPQLIDLYPNPASTKINLVISSPAEGEVEVEIIDVYGKRVSSEKYLVHDGQNILISDINKLSKGVYVAKINFIEYNNSDYKRFVKQ